MTDCGGCGHDRLNHEIFRGRTVCHRLVTVNGEDLACPCREYIG